MREILFRGKRVDNGEWVEGSIVVSQDRINYGKCYMTSSVCDFSYGDNGDRIRLGCFVEVIPDTVCQFTGLRDKNGKRIFEGDIVKTDKFNEPNKLYVITYDELMGAFIGDNENFYFTTFDGDSNLFEVIDNIHDNPELMKRE